MSSIIFGALYDGLPLIPLAVAFIWTLRYQQVADMSLAGSFSVAAACSTYLLSTGTGAPLSIGAGLLIGLLVGLFMAFCVNVLRVDPLLSGLVVLFITYAVSLGITEGTIRIPFEHNPLEQIFTAEVGWGMPLGSHPGANLIFFLLAAVTVALTTIALTSEWGCAFRALEDLKGGRPFLSSLGISPVKLSFIGFGIAGTLASASGILVALRDRQTTSSFGLETLIDIIPAYLLGMALFERRPTLKSYRRRDTANSKSPLTMVRDLAPKLLFGINSLPPTVSAAMGVIVFFLIINVAQRGAVYSFLPRVLVGLMLIALMGARPAYKHYVRRKRQELSTAITGPDEPLEIKNLSVSYPTTTGPKLVFEGVSLTVRPKEIVRLKGANGSGKSTFLRALADRIDCAGSFKIPAASGAASRQRSSLIAYVSQNADENMATTLSIAEQAVLAARGPKASLFRPWKQDATGALTKLGVNDVAPDSSALLGWLSGGQKRRVLLGLLAVRSPRPTVVVLDEPFNDLDTAGRAHCCAVISTLSAEGCAVLLVDHQGLIQPSTTVDLLWLGSKEEDTIKTLRRKHAI